MSKLKDISLDIRLVERNLAKGLITEKEYEKTLSKMKDLSESFEIVDISLPGYTPKDNESEETEE